MRTIRHPRLLAVLAATAVLAVALVATFDWNWLKGPLQNYLSGKFGREFVIHGNLAGEFSLTPLLTGTDVTLANAPWGSEPLLGRAKQAAVRVDLRTFFGDTVSLPELRFADATFLLERDAEGRPNWDFPSGEKRVDIGRFSFDGGQVRYFDRQRGIDVRSHVESAKAGDDGQLTIRFDGNGVWESGDIKLKGVATTPFAAGVADRSYRLNVEGTSGGTGGTFKGTVMPSKDGADVDGQLEIAGKDLSELGRFVPIEFSRTPPYRIAGQLKHGNGKWSLHELRAKIGETDLAGKLDIDRSGKQTQVAADLTSQTATYREMRALAGLPADDMRHARVEPAGKAKKAGDAAPVPDRAKGSPDMARLKLVDAKIRLKAKRFMAPQLRFDNLNAVIDIKDGMMKIQPFDFVLAGGQVTSTLSVDARGKVAKSVADVKVKDVDLNALLPKPKTPVGNAGKASGRGHFTATGNSVAEMLASSDGEAALISAGGNAGWISANLGRIDLSRAGSMLFRGEGGTPIRCAVADVALKDGVMDIRKLVVDTDSEAIVGDGRILLAERRYDLEFQVHPKRPSLAAFGGPVLVDGTFDQPNVHRKGGPLLARVGAVLGMAAISPLAALLPLLDGLGGEAGDQCKSLVRSTRATLKELKAVDPRSNGAGPTDRPQQNAEHAQAGSDRAPLTSERAQRSAERARQDRDLSQPEAPPRAGVQGGERGAAASPERPSQNPER